MRSACLPLVLVALASACGGGAPSIDAATDARDATNDTRLDAASACVTDLDCDDNVFCNGVERCTPGVAGADARGCVAANPATPCLPTQQCSEANRRCDAVCSIAEDADGDGHRALACGGDDCDDSDARRFPGNPEVCDDGHDEDCDTLTVGSRDADGDGYLDHQCCNRVPGTNAVCGNDCDDTMASVHPDLPEVCNGIDDNCNGQTDEGVSRLFFPDVDGDGYGDRSAMPMPGCAIGAGLSENSLDCNDHDNTVSPVAVEACNGIDDNCNALVDEAPASAIACASSYGTPANTVFACTSGTCAVSCTAPYANCDARLDNGCETNTQTDVNHCGACGNACGIGGECTNGVCDRVVQVAAGADYTCVRRSNGLVLCWGDNSFGQLGDGSGVRQMRPTVVRNLSGARYIAVSHDQQFAQPYQSCPATCAMHGNAVICWGCNNRGQVGNGTSGTIVSIPQSDVATLPSIDTRYGVGTLYPPVTIGGAYACVIQPGPGPGGGGAMCWGDNGYGQMNRASSGPQLTPIAVWSITTSNVSAGTVHACIIDGGPPTAPHGTVRCWGSNTNSESGATASTGSVTATAVPVVAGFNASSFVEVAAGFNASCARGGTNAGQVLCWGSGILGALGDGTTPSARAEARPVTGITNATRLVMGGSHACVIRSDGSVACWGLNDMGEIGDGTTTNALTPRTVPGITDAVDISASDRTTCVVHATGRVSCWGRNNNGQLGDESTTDRLSPVQVHGL